MKVAFYTPHLCLRGTTVALYDYAYYNEKILNNQSLVIYNKNDHRNNPETLVKFESKLQCIGIDSISDLDKTLSHNACDAVYIIKGGYKNDGRMATACKTLIHAIAMAPASEAHGDVYAYGSYWLSEKCSNNTLPAVPYMVDLPNINNNLREEFSIPSDAIVFGRNGGLDTWNLPFANDVIHRILEKRNDIYFLFQNTPIFSNHPQVIHIPATPDLNYKTQFINTCDAMLHARQEGESFGLSCGEFSIRNKPVITWTGSPEKNHLYILKDKGIYYSDATELFNILNDFKPQPKKCWNAYKKYDPLTVMKIFNKVFLENK